LVRVRPRKRSREFHPRFREASDASILRLAGAVVKTYDALHVWEWRGSIFFWNRRAGVEGFLAALERGGSWEGELCANSIALQKPVSMGTLLRTVASLLVPHRRDASRGAAQR
jgi:hypothetical protein